MKKHIIAAIMLITTTATAATWQHPVDAAPVVHYGQPVPGGISNATKYVVPKLTPVYAPSDGVLARNAGILQTYRNSDGMVWEMYGVFAMWPPATVQAGDYLGYAQSGTVYLLISDFVAPFVNGRYTPQYVRQSVGNGYYNAEAMVTQ